MQPYSNECSAVRPSREVWLRGKRKRECRMVELDKVRLAAIEEEFRSYPTIPEKIKRVLLSTEHKSEDVNAWIKPTGGHTETTLNDIVRKENNKGYIYYSALYADISHAYAKLADELQEIVDVYFWGEYKSYTWREIADQIGCSTAGAD